jgi:thioester reductase-like protein
VHAAAHVSSALPYTALRAANVSGTAHVVALARHSRARLLHISTLGFVDGGHAETLEVETSSLAFRSGYAQSKWLAERVVGAALEHHSLDVVVCRPGVICGCSHTGASNAKDAVMMLICGLVRNRVVCTGPGSPIPRWFNLIPVDTVAAAVVALAPASVNQPRAHPTCLVFHLCAPCSLSLDTICAWLRDAGHELNDIGADAFCRQVRAVDEDHPWFALKAQLSRPHAATREAQGGLAAPAMPQAQHAVAAVRDSGRPAELEQRGLESAVRYLLAL